MYNYGGGHCINCFMSFRVSLREIYRILCYTRSRVIVISAGRDIEYEILLSICLYERMYIDY